ncbi:MobA/MobL family protein [Sphingorhabdus sp.]|uniref:MobA/MobL family protein n=1 Tax=Sphingorhabdus sp. TaxID=1902408 RepID=UPI00398349F8
MAEIYVNDRWQRASETEIKRALREDGASTRLRAKERSRSVVEARAAALANSRSARAERAHVAAVKRLQIDLGLLAPSRDFGPRIRMRNAQRRKGKKRDLEVRITKDNRKAVPQPKAIRPKKPIIDARGRESVFVRVRYLGLKTPGWRPGRAGEHARYLCGEDAKLGREIITNMGDTLEEVVEAWNCIEKLEIGARKNAKVQQRIVIYLPEELSEDEQRQFVREYCEREFGRLGLGYSASVHIDPRGCNGHAHIDHSNRPFVRNGPYDWTFAAEKINGLDSKQGLKAMRARIASALNVALHKAGSERRYTHQSYAERGIAAHRQEHLGQQRAAAVRMGEAVAMAERNAARANANEAAYAVYCEQLKVDAAEQEVRHLETDQRDREALQQAMESSQSLHNLAIENASVAATAPLQTTTSGDQAKSDSTILSDARAQAKALRDSAMAIASLGSEANLEGTALSDADRRAFSLSRDLSPVVPLIKQIAAADVETSSMQDRAREDERYDAAIQKLRDVLEAKRVAAAVKARANVAVVDQQAVKAQAVLQKADGPVPQQATVIAAPTIPASDIKPFRPIEAPKQHIHKAKPDPAPTVADPMSAPVKLDNASQDQKPMSTPEVVPDLQVQASPPARKQEPDPPKPNFQAAAIGLTGHAVLDLLRASNPPSYETLKAASKLFDTWKDQDAQFVQRYVESLFDQIPANSAMHGWLTLLKQPAGTDKDVETAELTKQLLANEAFMIRIRAETPLLELMLFRQLKRHSTEDLAARGGPDSGTKHDIIAIQTPAQTITDSILESPSTPLTPTAKAASAISEPVPASKTPDPALLYQDIVLHALAERLLSGVYWEDAGNKRLLILTNTSAARLNVPARIEIAAGVVQIIDQTIAQADQEETLLRRYIERRPDTVQVSKLRILLPEYADKKLLDIADKHSKDPERRKLYAAMPRIAKNGAIYDQRFWDDFIASPEGKAVAEATDNRTEYESGPLPIRESTDDNKAAPRFAGFMPPKTEDKGRKLEVGIHPKLDAYLAADASKDDAARRRIAEEIVKDEAAALVVKSLTAADRKSIKDDSRYNDLARGNSPHPTDSRGHDIGQQMDRGLSPEAD